MGVTKIIIADDHPLMRKGLISYIEEQPGLCVVAEANNGEELLQKALATEADVIITDMSMPKKNGPEVIPVLAEKLPHILCIAISFLADPVLIHKVMNAGAKGYYVKTNELSELVKAIQEVVKGGIYYCSETWPIISRYERDLQANGKDINTLTEKEEEILLHLCDDLSIKEIAPLVGLAEETVRSYSKIIKQKTGTRSAAGMVAYAYRNFICFPRK